MGWGADVLDFSAGAGEGAVTGLRDQRDAAMVAQKIQQQEELAQMREEVRQAIASLNEEGRNARWGRVSGNVEAQQAGQDRRSSAEILASNWKWRTPSGNVEAQQAGETARTNAIVEGANTRAQGAEQGRNLRWSLPSGNVKLSTETTRRGQDLGAETTRRGQDFGFTLGTEHNTIARKRANQSIFGDQTVTGADQSSGRDVNLPALGAIPVTPRKNGGTAPLYHWSDGTTRAYPEGSASAAPAPPRAPARASIPVTPRRGDPALGGVQDPLTQLTLTATTLLQQFRAEKDPAKKAALAEQLKAARAALIAARGQ